MTVIEQVAPLAALVDECYSTSDSKGFHEPMSAEVLEGVVPLAYQLGVLSQALAAFRKERPIELPRLLDPGTLTAWQLEAIMRMLLIVSECWETVEAIVGDVSEEPEEVADIAIRLFDYCGTRMIDLDSVVEAKMAKNRGRPHKHGARF